MNCNCLKLNAIIIQTSKLKLKMKPKVQFSSNFKHIWIQFSVRKSEFVLQTVISFFNQTSCVLTSGFLDFGGAGFGHADGGLTVGVEQRSLQSS